MNPILVRELTSPDAIPDNPLVFLESLRGATAWRVAGRDRNRSRVVTTLLHGNEPSGLLAVHSWLRAGIQPAVDTLCVVANVEAARLHPVFTNRSVPSRRDLNRCFLGPFDDVEGQLAHAILDLVADAQPEALIDLHNNTGHNPAYSVGLKPTPETLALTALFGSRFVWSHLQLGALIEAIAICPALTIEVGKSGEAEADRVAREGLGRFLEGESLFDLPTPPSVQVLTMPMRAQLEPGRRLVMAQKPDPSADLTMPDDLDRHNFETVAVGAHIGWVTGEGCPLRLVDEAGHDRASEYFERQGDALVARRTFMPIMITVDAAIASSDCLFYVVHDAEI